MAARKQTSDRVSASAGELLWMLKLGYHFTCHPPVGRWRRCSNDVTRHVRAVAGSALSQDEKKGKRKARRK